MRADHLGVLGSVDQSRGEFTCLVDPECTVKELALFLAEGISRLWRIWRPGGRSVATLVVDSCRSEKVEEDRRRCLK